MCGRYSNHVNAMRDWIRILGEWPRDVTLSYNVAPSQKVPVFTNKKGAGMRWGLIPHWSKEDTLKFATFNARIESVASKPAFRSAWKKSQRCLIPAQGFYEWRKEGEKKQPYFICSKAGEALVFAGIWDVWKGNENEIHSCSILTTPANEKMKDLHSRMPVILDKEYVQDWLTASPEDAIQIAGIQDMVLDYYRVSLSVNNPRNDGPELIEKVLE
jgi:putative SOS response-associated peptidase YedK